MHVDWLGNENQVCRQQDKTNGYMKNGEAMARKPVTSTAERRPNKERSRRKSWHLYTYSCGKVVVKLLDYLLDFIALSEQEAQAFRYTRINIC